MPQVQVIMAIVYGGGTTYYTGCGNTEVINVSLPNIATGGLWIIWHSNL